MQHELCGFFPLMRLDLKFLQSLHFCGKKCFEGDSFKNLPNDENYFLSLNKMLRFSSHTFCHRRRANLAQIPRVTKFTTPTDTNLVTRDDSRDQCDQMLD